MNKLISTIVAALLSVSAAPAAAQGYPERAAKIIVPFAPGGIADHSARVIAQHLTETWGKPFIVENRPGAASIIAFTAVAKAPPDGYTLLHANTNIATNASLYDNLQYDADRDLVPVALGVLTPGVFVVHPSVPAKTLKELIALARAKPGELTYASVGTGSFPHLAVEQLQQQVGIRLTHVPYKGFAPGLTALLGGQVNMAVIDLRGALPHVKAGKLVALAATGAKRFTAMPELPTAAELGLADYEAVGWLGIMAPAGTPRDIVLKLNAEINRGLANSKTASSLAEMGAEVGSGTAEDFGAFIKRNRERWSGVIKTGGLKGGQ